MQDPIAADEGHPRVGIFSFSALKFVLQQGTMLLGALHAAALATNTFGLAFGHRADGSGSCVAPGACFAMWGQVVLNSQCGFKSDTNPRHSEVVGSLGVCALLS